MVARAADRAGTLRAIRGPVGDRALSPLPVEEARAEAAPDGESVSWGPAGSGALSGGEKGRGHNGDAVTAGGRTPAPPGGRGPDAAEGPRNLVHSSGAPAGRLR